jgi:dTMP kinase
MGTAFPPLLITFEGIDGSGKSTQAGLLVKRLAHAGENPLAVREPGGTAVSERVRALLLDPAAEITPRAELLLFAAARAQLVDEVIRPAMQAGRPVVCDRFYDSTTAYQGAGRRLADIEWLNELHRFTTAGLVPHRTYVIDVPIDVAATRRSAEVDRMEAAGDVFFEEVREAYRRLAELEGDRVRILDGRLAPAAIHEIVWEDLAALARGTETHASG